jgi:hypothetical protein
LNSLTGELAQALLLYKARQLARKLTRKAQGSARAFKKDFEGRLSQGKDKF